MLIQWILIQILILHERFFSPFPSYPFVKVLPHSLLSDLKFCLTLVTVTKLQARGIFQTLQLAGWSFQVGHDTAAAVWTQKIPCNLKIFMLYYRLSWPNEEPKFNLSEILLQLAQVLPTEENFLLFFRCQQLKSSEDFMQVQYEKLPVVKPSKTHLP